MKPEIVAGSALWPNGQPPEINKLWQEMKRDLRAAGDDWDVWTDWYEARLAGKRSSKKLEIARALIPDETWGQGPAVVNAEIKRLIENHTPPRPKKDTKTSPETQAAPQFPTPLENVLSPVSFGRTSKGTITVVAGSRNLAVYPYRGGERDHANRRDTCRTLASDLARSLRNGRYNARREYGEPLDDYVKYRPKQSAEGNFLLADAKARIMREMFAADVNELSTPLAAQLKIFLEQHIGLRAYYPQTQEFYESVRNGHLEAPLPMDAVEGFIQGIRENTPIAFEPDVAETLEGTAQPVPEFLQSLLSLYDQVLQRPRRHQTRLEKLIRTNRSNSPWRPPSTKSQRLWRPAKKWRRMSRVGRKSLIL